MSFASVHEGSIASLHATFDLQYPVHSCFYLIGNFATGHMSVVFGCHHTTEEEEEEEKDEYAKGLFTPHTPPHL